MINLPTKDNPITKSNQVNRLIVQWDRETEIPAAAYDFHTVVRELVTENGEGVVRIISDVSTGALELDRMTDDQKTILNDAIDSGSLLMQNSTLGQVIDIALADRKQAMDEAQAAREKEVGYEAQIVDLYKQIADAGREVEALVLGFVPIQLKAAANKAIAVYRGKLKEAQS